mmetsp:Transcript_24767/g.68984  ORF Transcript_24767/g.68984 Transcript_24767/m.68984 type:complete len:240 (-) Transcript_24767:1257-1976(-)
MTRPTLLRSIMSFFLTDLMAKQCPVLPSSMSITCPDAPMPRGFTRLNCDSSRGPFSVAFISSWYPLSFWVCKRWRTRPDTLSSSSKGLPSRIMSLRAVFKLSVSITLPRPPSIWSSIIRTATMNLQSPLTSFMGKKVSIALNVWPLLWKASNSMLVSVLEESFSVSSFAFDDSKSGPMRRLGFLPRTSSRGNPSCLMKVSEANTIGNSSMLGSHTTKPWSIRSTVVARSMATRGTRVPR